FAGSSDGALRGGVTGAWGRLVGGTVGRIAPPAGPTRGVAGRGAAGGAEGTLVLALLLAGAAGFEASLPFLNSPRATRSVPFACSILIGFVRTRFAPIRNAFATPACPSTTATASEDWLELG